jgi:hypothetical protein
MQSGDRNQNAIKQIALLHHEISAIKDANIF